jgi:hypothetical protein
MATDIPANCMLVSLDDLSALGLSLNSFLMTIIHSLWFSRERGQERLIQGTISCKFTRSILGNEPISRQHRVLRTIQDCA